MKTQILFEAPGIMVYVDEDGTLIEADDRNVFEYEDTPENRAEAVADAQRTVAEWERGRSDLW